MKLVTQVITVSVASTVKTAKIQLHPYFVYRVKGIRFYIMLTYKFRIKVNIVCPGIFFKGVEGRLVFSDLL